MVPSEMIASPLSSTTVKYPAIKFVTLNSEAIHREVQQIRTRFGRRPIVGIGHSKGAAALRNVEARNPRTFGGLVCFEPFVEEPGTPDPKIQRYIFNFALNRQHRWETRQATVKYFKNVKGACWLEGAIVPVRPGAEAVVLACHPTIEAAIYCGERLWLYDSEMGSVACCDVLHLADTKHGGLGAGTPTNSNVYCLLVGTLVMN